MPRTSHEADKKRAPVLIDLALQGGGSHGAFTWGVLDRLLEEPWLQIEAISGTSAGAMNAAVLADGWTKGGAAGAREALDAYWERVARAALFSPLQRTPLDRAAWALVARHLAGLRRPGPDGAGFFALRPQSARLQSAEVDPRGEHRFRAAGAIAYQAVHHRDQCPHRPRPHLSQRRDHSGRSARFGMPADDVSGGRDRRRGVLGGGYAGNPTITPLVRESDAQDTILVQINPRERPGTPRTASEILNRLNEVSFNATLMKELRMIALLRQVADPGSGEGARWAGCARTGS